MKKFAQLILLINGMLFLLIYAISILYDYHLMKSRMFTDPYGIELTLCLSGILFFLPGIFCLTASILIKIKENK